MIRKWMIKAVVFSMVTSACSATPPRITTDIGSGKFNLQPEPKHFTVAKVITGAIEEYHYKKVKLDDSLSSQIFNRYLEDLDASHSTLMASDVKDFEKFRYELDDQLKAGDLTAGYYIYNHYANKLSERIDFALALLKTKLNLDSTDVYMLDREKEPWFNNTTDLDNYWNKRLRYELINQKLISKDEKKAYEIIKKRYENLKTQLDKLKSEDVFETYMNAFSSTVEPHTVYLSPKNSADFKIDMSRSLEGIGATLRYDEGYTKVVQLSKGGPAEKSKQVQPNDRIIAVAQGNGEFVDVVGWRIDDVVGKIRGPKGTTVRLQIIPAGADAASAPKTVVLVRDKVVLEEQKAQSEVKKVTYNGKQYKIGVIAVPAFYIDWDAMRKKDPNYTSTSRDVRNALNKFKAEGIDGVVIDLRNNGGGSLKEAIELTGLFIKTGPVVQVRESNGNVSVNEDNDPEITYTGPLTVLINRFSASASEIFSAAMQDYQRGLIIGEQSYGKGTVQTAAAINELINKKDDMGQLNLTVAKFYRISGGSTQHKGVIPDIEFPSMLPADQFGESSEPTALPWDQIDAATYRPVGQLNLLKPIIEADHLKREQTSQEYKYMLEDIKEFEKNSKRKTLVLNTELLKKERDEKEGEELARYNERRKAMGEKPVAKGVNRTPLNNDYVKDESLQVTAELISKVAANTIAETPPKK